MNDVYVSRKQMAAMMGVSRSECQKRIIETSSWGKIRTLEQFEAWAYRNGFKYRYLDPLPSDWKKVREMPPAGAMYHLSDRILNCLEHCGIEKLKDLEGKSFEEIGKWRNMGRKSISELREFLSRYGVRETGVPPRITTSQWLLDDTIDDISEKSCFLAQQIKHLNDTGMAFRFNCDAADELKKAIDALESLLPMVEELQ